MLPSQPTPFQRELSWQQLKLGHWWKNTNQVRRIGVNLAKFHTYRKNLSFRYCKGITKSWWLVYSYNSLFGTILSELRTCLKTLLMWFKWNGALISMQHFSEAYAIGYQNSLCLVRSVADYSFAMSRNHNWQSTTEFMSTEIDYLPCIAGYPFVYV